MGTCAKRQVSEKWVHASVFPFLDPEPGDLRLAVSLLGLLPAVTSVNSSPSSNLLSLNSWGSFETLREILLLLWPKLPLAFTSLHLKLPHRGPPVRRDPASRYQFPNVKVLPLQEPPAALPQPAPPLQPAPAGQRAGASPSRTRVGAAGTRADAPRSGLEGLGGVRAGRARGTSVYLHPGPERGRRHETLWTERKPGPRCVRRGQRVPSRLLG